MNVRPQNLTVSQAIEGFILHKNAQGLSQRTVSSYKDILEHWAARIGGDTQVPAITSQDLKRYLVWKTTEYVPIRKNGKTHPLSPKTTRNIYVTFQAFFRWIGEEFEFPTPMKGIPVPKFVSPPIEPFTKDEVVSMVKGCVQKRESRPSNRKAFTTRRPYTLRDQTVIKFLLDTGLRASEFTSLRISDVDLVTGRVIIRTGKEGGAKGGQGRIVFVGNEIRRSLWKYLKDRPDAHDPQAPLFLNNQQQPYCRNSLRLFITKLGKKLGIKAHPHKFRHTFAINYLRNGGDVFTLQDLLGHHSLEMVRHYARLAEVDIAAAHKRASPVDNWRL
jgi:integrase/recombinase XerD